jgi:hypothetical protein
VAPGILPAPAAVLLRDGIAAADEPAAGGFHPAGLQPYFIGEPTAQEQEYLERINRARADPTGEARRWQTTADPDIRAAYAAFGVDLALMAAQLSGLPPAQPLAFHPQLLAAARRHTRDQFEGGFQSHVGSDGSHPGSRITAAGYAWSTCGENVYAAARSVAHGHAAFEVDWGAGPGGMQSPAGHRLNIHNPNFREAGVAVTNGFRGAAGPQVVTEDFAARAEASPLITGVVYYDLNANETYDAGEGLGGVHVTVAGTDYLAVTAAAGGYAVPVPGNGTYTVTFRADHLDPVQHSITVVDGLNAKLDWRPPYAPPALTGPVTLAPGQAGLYTFAPVGGALGHQWRHSRRIAATLLEGAEAGAPGVTSVTSPGYAVLQQSVRASGLWAFRLAHPLPIDQHLAWNRPVRPGPAARLELASRLGWATTGQVARVQATTNAGRDWLELWSRTGTGTAGQTQFELLSISLAGLAGSEIEVRLAYDHAGGTYFNQVSTGVGWYVDDLRLTGCEELVDTEVGSVTGTNFTFTPATPSEYWLRVRALTVAGPLDWGPPLPPSVGGAATGLRVRLVTWPAWAGDRAVFEFVVEGGPAAGLGVETAPAPAGPWTPDLTATIEAMAPDRFRAGSARGPGPQRFYRVTAR